MRHCEGCTVRGHTSTEKECFFFLNVLKFLSFLDNEIRTPR